MNLSPLDTGIESKNAIIKLEKEVAELRGKIKEFYDFLNLSNERLYIVDKTGAYQFITKSMAANLHVPVHEFIGKKYGDFHPPEATGRFEKMLAKVLDTGRSMEEEILGTLSEKNLYRIFHPIKSPEGDVTKVLVVVKDITDRKKMETRLWQSQEQHSALIDSIGEALYAVDRECRYGFITATLAARRNMSPEDMVGKKYSDFHNPEASRLLAEKVHRVFAEGACVQDEYFTGRGTWVLRSLYPIRTPLPTREVVMAGVLSQDITARKNIEETLRKSEIQYRSLVENAKEGIFQRKGKRFLTVNQAFADMLGYESPEEVMETITTNITQLYVRPEDRDKLRETMVAQGSVKAFETELYRKDGSRTWVSMSMQAIRDIQGQWLYNQGICEDITLRKQVDEERQQAFDRLRKALGGTVQAMALVVEARDPYTAGHQRRVADLARSIATEMGLSSDQIDGLRMASTIHDVGKICVPQEILSKPAKLTDIEFSLIKAHPGKGHEILKDIDFSWPIARMVLEHHERLNGSGYPEGLPGDKLLLESLILSVADVVESMASHRPYRPALGIDPAFDEITRNKGILYDPAVVEACRRLFYDKGYKLVAL